MTESTGSWERAVDNPTIDRRTATPDPPPKGIPNPIHDAEGADGAGYAGALVAGVRTYGWAAETIERAIGSSWLSEGWVDYSLRRPLFAGEELTVTVTPDPKPLDDAGSPVWTVAVAAAGAGGARVVLDGTAGLGVAPWFDELAPPPFEPGQEPPPVRQTYDVDSAPIGQPLRPLTVRVGADAARRLADDDLGIDNPRYRRSDGPLIHPYFLAARMAPLTRHNFTYGPTIHVRSQVQHRAEARSEQEITVGAAIVQTYERNEHWYQVLDGSVTGSGGTGEPIELARIRHHTIFRPRGTTMPPPIGGDRP